MDEHQDFTRSRGNKRFTLASEEDDRASREREMLDRIGDYINNHEKEPVRVIDFSVI